MEGLKALTTSLKNQWFGYKVYIIMNNYQLGRVN